jgi:predicted aspartyl protease
MGAFRITVEVGDPDGQRFVPVEMLVDTGATFTKAPRELLEGLGVPVESTYTAELADGSRIERTRGRTMIRLERKEFPTPVTFGEAGEQSLLGAMALEDAMLAVDPHTQRLMPVNAPEMSDSSAGSG